MLMFSLATFALLLSQLHQTNAVYNLYKNYSGSTFFDEWDYFGAPDYLTHGNVIYVNQSDSAQLAYVNNAGRAIIKVDNSTNLAIGVDRSSVRISTQSTFGLGSLWVFDAYHLPYGCSVWPAFWAVGPNWPLNGEIDTFEGVNQQTANAYAIHTATGCTIPANQSSMTGLLTNTNCSIYANQNQGCTVTDPSTNSYGAQFAASGGGVWATEFSLTGIRIWFFTRNSVPSDLLATNTSAQPNPDNWGLPVANYANQSSCDIQTYFGPQLLTLDITLCGDYAGNSVIYNQTCTLRQSCSTDNVPTASNYDNAYFEIGSVRVYNDGSQLATDTSIKSTPTGSATAGSSTSTPKASEAIAMYDLSGSSAIFSVIACLFVALM